MARDVRDFVPSEVIASALLLLVAKLQHQRELHTPALVGACVDLDLAEAIDRVAEVAEALAPELRVFTGADALPEVWPMHVTLGPIEGFCLLRRRILDGRPSALVATDAGPTCAVVTVLDDGGVGWRGPELDKLDDEQLEIFRQRARELEQLLTDEQARRAKR